MRKYPEFKIRLCKQCGDEYKPTGASQRFCLSCSIARIKESKKRWAERNYPDRRAKQKSTEKCCICGEIFSSHYEGKAYCNKHYLSMRAYGQPYGKPRRSTNQFLVDGDLLKIITKDGTVFLADAEDFDKLKGSSWCLSKNGICSRKYKK